MSNLPPPSGAPLPSFRREATPLGRIFLIIFVVVWVLTALFALAQGGGLLDVVFCSINGAVWGGLVVFIIWLVRKARR